MPDLPRITVITPSYNQGAYIRQTIASVLSQGYPDLEYIVIDGGSTDGTLDVLNSYNGLIHWLSEPDRGQSHAINKGFRIASGDVIGILNSDDLYEPAALLRVGRFFSQHPQACWLTGKCRTVDRDNREIRRLITLYKNSMLPSRSFYLFTIINYMSQPATFWRREVLDTVGYFDEDWHYAMDYDYLLRIGKRYKLWFLNQYLARFRIHNVSKTGSLPERQFEADLAAARKHVHSPFRNKLHQLHNELIVRVYKILQSKV
jgi:glycosyltransferase involved in cell wall biosynthesis